MTTTRLKRNLWRIELSKNCVPFKYTLMRRETQGYGDNGTFLRSDRKVVIVDLAKFIKLAERAPNFLDPCTTWKEEELMGVTEFLRPCPSSASAVLMPVVGHHFRFIEKKCWQFWRSNEKVFYAEFTNGRHRTRLLEYGGAKDIPVEVNCDSLDFYMNTCGLHIEEEQ